MFSEYTRRKLNQLKITYPYSIKKNKLRVLDYFTLKMKTPNLKHTTVIN